jgi:non-ribosomal peptide synthetase component F
MNVENPMNVYGNTISARCINEFYLCADNQVLYAAQQRDNDMDASSEFFSTDAESIACMGSVLSAHLRGAHGPLSQRLIPLQRRFEIIAQTYPGAPAVRCRDQVLSYGELDTEADELALHLQNEGLAAGSFCIIRMEPSLAQVRAILAILKAGAVCLQFDPALSAPRMAAVLELLCPAMMFVHGAACDMPGGGAMRVVYCEDKPAQLPYGWPDEVPVGPATPAHAFAGLSHSGGMCIWICTHLGLGRSLDGMPIPPPLAGCGADPAAMWRPLSSGALLTIPSCA